MTKQEKISLFQMSLSALNIGCDRKMAALLHEIHEAVFSLCETLPVWKLAQLATEHEKKWNEPQIEDAPPVVSILGMQSRFDVADVIQALINGERFPDCGDSVIENLKQIKFNRPADTQREIEHIIMGFCHGDMIQDFIPELASKFNA